MYRIALKQRKGLKIGLNSLSLEAARGIKNRLNSRKNTHCIIITEASAFSNGPIVEVL